jgi:Na+/proline symporter
MAPILLGLFWKRGNGWGAVAGVLTGMSLYGLAHTLLPAIAVFGLHPALPSAAGSALAYVAVTLATPRPSADVVDLFWGRARRPAALGPA